MKRAMIHPFYPALQMNKHSPFVTVPDFFNSHECGKIRAQMVGGHRAMIEGSGAPREDMTIRGTTIAGIQPVGDNRWIFERLQEVCLKVNFDLWGFDLAGFCEGIQISRYNVGDHYDWHMDIGGGILSQRKLSIVAQLTPAFEYQGGELEFFKLGDAPKEQGSLILFPSYMQHRVRQVVKGIRYSLVAWVSGNPYK